MFNHIKNIYIPMLCIPDLRINTIMKWVSGLFMNVKVKVIIMKNFILLWSFVR